MKRSGMAARFHTRTSLARASPVQSLLGHVPLRVPISRLENDRYIDFQTLQKKLQVVRKRLQRPMTYSEKVLYSHLENPEEASIERGSSYLKLLPSRVACQDATAQMALLQFMSANINTVAVPTTVHCDHLVIANKGVEADIASAESINREVYDFMGSACAKFGAGFWKPGAGIIHQIILENYAYPGGLMIGTDSHTPNAGGLGMAAIGVGGADAVDVMAGLSWELKNPKVIGVKLTGHMSGWASAKDVILNLAGILTVKGATGAIIEYFGPGVDSLSCTGMATIANMGAETGATTSIFPFRPAMSTYLHATGRPEIAAAVEHLAPSLQADEGAEYDQIIEINLSELEPHISGPYTPDLAFQNSEFKKAVQENDWPKQLSAALIGSCTNSSYEDMTKAADIARQALDQGVELKSPLYISPGSEQILSTLERDGILEPFEKLGAVVLSSACGPCCGSWKRDDVQRGEANSIISSYNRNFASRNDSNPATRSFLASPEIVVAKAFGGSLDFDAESDALTTKEGKEFRFKAPDADVLPRNGYVNTDYVYTAPPTGDRSQLDVMISPESDRLQRLEPFKAWDGKDFTNMPVLIKVKGKCTTDHITLGGPWLKYRGHLANISNNTLIGAVNAENGEVNNTTNVLTGHGGTIPEIANEYKAVGQKWVVVADHNYGEGSSREHAALQVRYLNGAAIIAKSFARIHESNLKKQGMLALTFQDEVDYDRIRWNDRIDLVDLAELSTGKPVRMRVHCGDGSEWETHLNHTFNEEQVGFFRAGSALNLMAQAGASGNASKANSVA